MSLFPSSVNSRSERYIPGYGMSGGDVCCIILRRFAKFFCLLQTSSRSVHSLNTREFDKTVFKNWHAELNITYLHRRLHPRQWSTLQTGRNNHHAVKITQRFQALGYLYHLFHYTGAELRVFGGNDNCSNPIGETIKVFSDHDNYHCQFKMESYCYRLELSRAC